MLDYNDGTVESIENEVQNKLKPQGRHFIL